MIKKHLNEKFVWARWELMLYTIFVIILIHTFHWLWVKI